MGGKFLNGREDEMQYVGGVVRTRCIKEGTTYETFRKIVSSIIGTESNDFCLKFKVALDTSTYVELVDNEGVEHLIKFNEDYGHVYVEEDCHNAGIEGTTNDEREEEEV